MEPGLRRPARIGNLWSKKGWNLAPNPVVKMPSWFVRLAKGRVCLKRLSRSSCAVGVSQVGSCPLACPHQALRVMKSGVFSVRLVFNGVEFIFVGVVPPDELAQEGQSRPPGYSVAKRVMGRGNASLGKTAVLWCGGDEQSATQEKGGAVSNE